MIQAKDIPIEIIVEAQTCEAANAKARKALSEAILKAAPYAKDDVIRDTDTGACYRVKSGHGWFDWTSNAPRLSLTCHRVYKTGRREASSATHLSSFARFEKLGTIKDWLS